MSNTFFQFKQFRIDQDRCAMKVGTDGILLGAWARVKEATHILDIGTGTGLLALMAAQRNPLAKVDAVEIDPVAAGQAAENFDQSPWNRRLSVYPTDIVSFEPGYLYGCILCNPPFFQSGLQPGRPTRKEARHAIRITFTELLAQSTRLLGPDGHMHLILPVREGKDFLALAESLFYYPLRKTFVRSFVEKPPHRVLVALGREKLAVEESELVIFEGKDQYSQPFRKLTADFYLNH